MDEPKPDVVPHAVSADPRIPVYILSGFLGAGKTTFLRRALQEPALSNSMLLVNEIGEFGVDDRLIRLDGSPALLLGNGCICCTANDDLDTALNDAVRALNDGNVIERLIIETTGLANPLPVMSTIANSAFLAAALRVELAVTLVDALNANASEARSEDYLRQIQAADVVLMSKTDIADDAQIAHAQGLIAGTNPLCASFPVIGTTFADLIALASTLRADRLSRSVFGDGHRDATPFRHATNLLRRKPSKPRAKQHSLGAVTFCIEIDEPLDWIRFSVWLSLLLHVHGEKLLRIKGFLSLADSPAPIVLNCVHHLAYFPEHLKEWPDDLRKSFLVFIVRDLDPAAVFRSLTACVTPTMRLLDAPLLASECY